MNHRTQKSNAQRAGVFVVRPLVKHVSIALAFGTAALLHSGVTLADEADEAVAAQAATAEANSEATKAAPEGAALPSVTVTAQKREENVQSVATAVSTLGGKELTDNGIGRSASEILNYVPNASAGTQQHSRPRWWIRGVGAGQQQWDLANPVGFYLDDVYISNASATGFPLFDLDHVEVLRGPQGTLWGKNTTGGAIDVLSKKPSFNDSKTDDYLKVDYGSYNDRVVEGAVGGTIIDERLAGRISFHDEDQGGIRRNLFTGNKDGGFNDGAIRGQLLAQLTPDLDALLNVHYRKYKTDGTIVTTASYAANGVLRNGYAPSTGYTDVSANAANHSDTTQDGASLKLNWQLGKLALTSITGYEGFESEALTDGDNTPLEISRGHTYGKSTQWSQELRLASPREDRWNWLSGVHLFREDLDYNAQNAQLPPGSVASLASSPILTTPGAAYNASVLNHKDTSFALFGSTTYNFTDSLDATFGLRWSKEKKEYTLNRVGSPNGTSSTAGLWGNLGSWWNNYLGPTQASGTLGSGTFSTANSKTWDAWTYDFTPEYKITAHDRVFFKYAHGVKSGGFNTAATNLAAVNTVAPEKLDSFELGYKSEWLNGRVNFNATAFHYEYKDVQVNVVGTVPLTTTPVSYLQNAAKAHADGAEFELEALPIENLHLNANLGLLHTQYDDAQILNNGGNFSGNQLVRSPHVTALLAADYRIPLANGGKVVVGGDAHYTSKQYYYVTPQTDARYNLNQEAYTIVNARLAYSTVGEKYTWTAYVNNLFDKEYHNHAVPAYQTTNGGTVIVVNGDNIYQGAPRTIGLSFITRF